MTGFTENEGGMSFAYRLLLILPPSVSILGDYLVGANALSIRSLWQCVTDASILRGMYSDHILYPYHNFIPRGAAAAGISAITIETSSNINNPARVSYGSERSASAVQMSWLTFHTCDSCFLLTMCNIQSYRLASRGFTVTVAYRQPRTPFVGLSQFLDAPDVVTSLRCEAQSGSIYVCSCTGLYTDTRYVMYVIYHTMQCCLYPFFGRRDMGDKTRHIVPDASTTPNSVQVIMLQSLYNRALKGTHTSYIQIDCTRHCANNKAILCMPENEGTGAIQRQKKTTYVRY